MTIKTSKIMLSAGSEPPREFRIFASGWNETSKGKFLFDSDAAKAVMEAFARSGTDGMIDLEHLSIDDKAPNFDPDARGWCQLAVRNGELWAVNVAWTNDGAARLREKRQRYISPYFGYDPETMRILEIYNIGMCAMPATYDAPALIAASKRAGKQIATLSIEVPQMEELKKIALALGLEETATLEEVLAAIKTYQDSAAAKDGEDVPPKDEDAGTDEEKAGRALARAPKLLGRVLAALGAKAPMEKRIADLEQKHQDSDRAKLIAANLHKIPKTLEKWANDPKTTLVTLSEYFEHAPALPGTSQNLEPQRPKGETAGAVALTEADKAYCKANKRDEAKFLAEKQKLHARDTERMS